MLHPVAHLRRHRLPSILTIVFCSICRAASHAGDTVALGLALCGLAQFLLSFFREPAFYDNDTGQSARPSSVGRARYDRTRGTSLAAAHKEVAHAV